MFNHYDDYQDDDGYEDDTTTQPDRDEYLGMMLGDPDAARKFRRVAQAMKKALDEQGISHKSLSSYDAKERYARLAAAQADDDDDEPENVVMQDDSDLLPSSNNKPWLLDQMTKGNDSFASFEGQSGQARYGDLDQSGEDPDYFLTGAISPSLNRQRPLDTRPGWARNNNRMR